MASRPLATVAILSIGDMGAGIARLLAAHNFTVVTNITGRSAATHARAASASVKPLDSDADVIQSSDFVLSIVPPRDALSTAQRVADAYDRALREASGRPAPLYFLDLNAVAPSTGRRIGELLGRHGDGVRYIDGGIIGGPPRPGGGPKPGDTVPGAGWTRPSIVLSGPHRLDGAPAGGEHLAAVLRARHVGEGIGTASGLKCCFASLTKGFTALAIQSFCAAAQLGVLEQLQEHLGEFAPAMKAQGEKGIVGMPPKAYRWVDEMKEISKGFRESAGWSEEIYDTVGEVYRFVAEDTVLGEEKTEQRTRTTVESVIEGLTDGLAARNNQRS